MIRFLLICTSTLFSMYIFGQDITGKWNGTIKVSNTELLLVLHVKESGDSLTAVMDSPDQRAYGIPVSSISFYKTDLIFSIASLGASYHGKFDDTGIIRGEFSQMGVSVPLNLSRSEIEKNVPNRPQEPKPPFPYLTEEVTFTNSKDHVTLAGTLTKPNQKGKFPVVVLISGSGPQNRDEELMGHKPFLVIADYLTRNGIGVLRYDDRGTAESTGDFSTATTFDFANDAEASVQYLLTRKDVNTEKIGLIGHSEGGIIAPIVASRNKKVAYVVLLAGTGVRGDELLLMQQKAMAKVSGIPESAIIENEKLNRPLFREIIESPDTVELRSRLHRIMERSLNENLLLKQQLSVEQLNDMVSVTVDRLLSPWMYHFIKYDPYPNLKKVKCPILALNGSNDLQVPAKVNLSAIQKAFHESGNTNVTIVEISGLNHLFQESKTGSPDEYAKIEQTFSPKALEEILNWIKMQIN
ncbi:MAG: alpha/beta hydrolase family protein [Paludibacteraceae bacterium]